MFPFHPECNRTEYSPAWWYPAESLRCLPGLEIRCIEATLNPSQTLRRGTVMAETDTPCVFETYVPGVTGPAKGVLRFPTWVDINGICTVDGARRRWDQRTFLTIPIIQVGLVLTRQLIGLDEAAVANLGRLLDGTLADGVLDMR